MFVTIPEVYDWSAIMETLLDLRAKNETRFPKFEARNDIDRKRWKPYTSEIDDK